MKMKFREFPGGPVVRTPRFHCRGPGLLPGRATKIPKATWRGQKKKKKKKFSQNDEKHLVFMYATEVFLEETLSRVWNNFKMVCWK